MYGSAEFFASVSPIGEGCFTSFLLARFLGFGVFAAAFPSVETTVGIGGGFAAS